MYYTCVCVCVRACVTTSDLYQILLQIYKNVNFLYFT